jgi:hypothetical protein
MIFKWNKLIEKYNSCGSSEGAPTTLKGHYDIKLLNTRTAFYRPWIVQQSEDLEMCLQIPWTAIHFWNKEESQFFCRIKGFVNTKYVFEGSILKDLCVCVGTGIWI